MGDYFDEQPSWPSIDDATVEALLAGGEVAPDLAPVAAVVGALKDTATRPTPPGPELAARMARGTFGHNGLRSPRVAGALRRVEGWLAPWYPRGGAAGAEAPTRLTAKAASVAMAIVLIGVGTAGFAGALPAAAQDRFEEVVESVTPYEFPKVKVGSCGLDRDGVADGDAVDEGSSGDPGAAPGSRGPAHRDQGGGEDAAAPGREVREQARGEGVERGDGSAQARGGSGPAGPSSQGSPGSGPVPGAEPPAGQGTAGAPGQNGSGPDPSSREDATSEEDSSTGQDPTLGRDASSADGATSDTGPSSGPQSGEGGDLPAASGNASSGHDPPPSAGSGGQSGRSR